MHLDMVACERALASRATAGAEKNWRAEELARMERIRKEWRPS